MDITYRIESRGLNDECGITMGSNLDYVLRIVQHIGHIIIKRVKIVNGIEENM